MNALTPAAMAVKGSFKASCGTARALKNASTSAQFEQDRRETPREAPRQRPRVVVELVSQGETKRHDPFWDAPRLTPAFVTQLLGQVMDEERLRLVRAPYGIRGEKSARLLDTRF